MFTLFFFFSFVDRMELGKIWFKSVQNSSYFPNGLSAELKISPPKNTFGIQGNILHLPRMSYSGFFMGYLTL